jgi:hypothetical protein
MINTIVSSELLYAVIVSFLGTFGAVCIRTGDSISLLKQFVSGFTLGVGSFIVTMKVTDENTAYPVAFLCSLIPVELVGSLATFVKSKGAYLIGKFANKSVDK